MTEETKVEDQPKAEQPKTDEAPKRRGRTAPKAEHGIKNMRSGDVNLGGMLFMKAGEVVELTTEQKKNSRLMAKVKRATEIGLLKEV